MKSLVSLRLLAFTVLAMASSSLLAQTSPQMQLPDSLIAPRFLGTGAGEAIIQYLELSPVFAPRLLGSDTGDAGFIL